MNIFIGGAWPYANGSLHLGHISSLLPGDILARYYRTKGEKVLYVSGSDCNGTPITIRAKQDGVSPKVIADHYHLEFKECFKKLGFSFDCYTRTDTVHHHHVVQEIFLDLLEKGFIEKKEVEQTYCESCIQFLPDRYVEGNCPQCGNQARGDQCDNCSKILDPIDLIHKSCKLCGNSPTIKQTEHFYFALSMFQNELEKYLENAKSNHLWRENALQLTSRYLKEGLIDRAATRDLPVGVSVPIKGYEEKKIYVWIEAVSGYYSASRLWAMENAKDDSVFWNEKAKTYYVHGKDNIPFHSIIWPAILIGIGNKGLPMHIVSNEYLTVEKKKLSTSRNWAVWVPEVLEKYHPDSIRYFLTINAPENRDTDFSWREFIYSHNSELLGAYGNLVNRTFKFIEKYYDNEIPTGTIKKEFEIDIELLYQKIGKRIESSQFKEALTEVFTYIRKANKFFDEEQPWKKISEDKCYCDITISNCVFLIANLVQLLSPFLPFSSNEVKEIIGIDKWRWQTTTSYSNKLSNTRRLFERIEIKTIDEEVNRLHRQANL